MRPARPWNILVALLLSTLFLAGCEGSGSSTGSSASPGSGSGGGGTGTSSGIWYMAVRAYDTDNDYSPYSNEASGRLDPGTRVTLAWQTPTRTLDGECTTISGFVIDMGTQSASYSHSMNVHTTSNYLSCTATGVDSQCSTNINTCEVEITIPTS